MTVSKRGNLSSDRQLDYGSVLLAETVTLANDKNPYSGMTNPVLLDGQTSFVFESIPQNFTHLRLMFSDMAHTENSNSGYRLKMAINGDTSNTRYYTRSGIPGGGNYGAQGHTADNTDSVYIGYIHRPENTTWSSSGELYIPLYSKQMPYNQRTGWGQWWSLSTFGYPYVVGWNYYNNVAASLPVTSLSFTMDGAKAFRSNSKVSLYGIK